MPNTYFQFKQFTIHQDRCAMKVTTDACLFGAWTGNEVRGLIPVAIGTEVRNALDIGTGTGLLSLMIAQKNTKLIIDAIETDEDAAEQAAENAEASPWEDRLKIIHADARKFSFQQQYDVIISNPPFYENELKADDKKKNVARHSDDLSIAQLLTVIKNNLSPDGTFYLLLPYKRNDEVRKFLLENDLKILKLVFVKQSVNHDYFRIMLKGKLNPDETTETTIDEMAITDENGQYTATFKTMLSDYYLHL